MSKSKKRLPLLDFLRGFAIIDMIIFHYLYDIYVVSGSDIGWASQPTVHIWQQWGLSLFILVSGMACALMSIKKLFLRGLQLNVIGGLITLITTCFMPSERIVFGVLNFFGCAFWLTALVRWLCSNGMSLCSIYNWMIFTLICAGRIIFHDIHIGVLRFGFMQWHLPTWMHNNWMIPFGLSGKDFYSADYVPLLPHVFVLWGGMLLMGVVRRHCPQLLTYGNFAPITFCGRHSLMIYLVHQPVLLFLLGML